MKEIEPDHPRAKSLKIRKKIAEGFKKGLVTPEGLSAHGRGEAFDYLLGEKTTEEAEKAIQAAAARLLLAKEPVFSVNGNVAALIPDKIAKLEKTIDIKIEVNLFHKSEKRAKKIAKHLKEKGVSKVLGVEEEYSTSIPEIKSHRKIVDRRGIKKANSILVPLEDGDRTEALEEIGRTVVTVDLNPLSRTAKAADVTIVDNVVRALPALIKQLKKLKDSPREKLEDINDNFDNEKNLKSMIKNILDRLDSLSKN